MEVSTDTIITNLAHIDKLLAGKARKLPTLAADLRADRDYFASLLEESQS